MMSILVPYLGNVSRQKSQRCQGDLKSSYNVTTSKKIPINLNNIIYKVGILKNKEIMRDLLGLKQELQSKMN